MNDPNDGSDDWDELAREFALDKPASEGPDEPARPESESGAPVPDAAEAETDNEFEDADEAGEPGSEGDAATGTGRKRRRRRRRRRKGGAPGDSAVVAGATEDGSEEAEAPDEAAETEPAATADNDAPTRDDESDDEADEFNSEPAPLTAEEDTASEVLRELIATWNVPSWDSIVSGLYRPN
ncbi:hypothetical protein R5W23_005833 [Gemmata sp. JC673]|uniref:Uncharacterized protein n=1 Tax=Gemmata algarum TaxID=2975278 RepID=A0ABU5EU95_9BACT|nr:hypothetical protein [Gemmata algarum]MDY3558691.1 hypothetical protein [Gemmata algarum]